MKVDTLIAGLGPLESRMEKQILRLTTPNLNSVWGPVRSG